MPQDDRGGAGASQATGVYMLEEGRWAGLTEFPVQSGWPAGSPVLIEQITPMNTGLGDLQIAFIQPLYPGGGRRRTIVAQVVQRAPTHLTCLFAEGRQARTAILALPDFAWLRCCAPELLARRRPTGPRLLVRGQPDPVTTADDYLSSTFGYHVETVLHGARPSSFAAQKRPASACTVRLSLDMTLEPFDSALVARGFVPEDMGDKWFVVYHDGRLLFRRSWTGILVYDVEAVWQGDRLRLGEVLVDRAATRAGATANANASALQDLRQLIVHLLIGVDPHDATGRGASLNASHDLLGN